MTAPTRLARIARLLARLPVGARVAWLGVVVFHALGRVGIVCGVLALARGEERAALAIAIAMAGLTFALGALRSSVGRHARAAVVEAMVQAMLEGPILGSASEDDLLVTAHEGLVLGRELVADRTTAVSGDLLAAPLVGVLLVLEVDVHVLAVGVLAAGAAGAVVIAVRSLTTPLVEAARSAFNPVYADIAAAADGRLDIVASGRDTEFRRALSDHISTWQRIARRSEAIVALAGRGPTVAAVLVVATAIVLDASIRGEVGRGTLTKAAVVASAAPLFLGLTKGLLDLQRTVTRLRPLFLLLECDRAPRGVPGGPLPTVLAPIVWQDVSFAYPDARETRRLALNGVSVTWNRGQVLALRGPNGCGKSTLFRLLLGLAHPLTGTVKVGEVSVLELDLPTWRRAIAYLPQRPYLGDRGTVREAIRLLATRTDDDRMRRSIQAVGLSGHTFCASGDPLEVRVSTLSAGQRQRLALARTLCQDGAIVVLDEPDANLDADGIEMVERVISQLRRDRMVAIAAHTPRLLHLADVLVDMGDEAPHETPGVEATG